MKVRFLLDENFSPRLKLALHRYDPNIDIVRIGDEGAPPLGTLDPDVLLYLEATQRFMITDNRRSIPGHLADHQAAHRHHWGIAWIRPSSHQQQVLNTLYLIWSASEAEE